MKRSQITRFLMMICAAAFVVSCDSDYSEVGTNIIGDSNFLLQGTPFGITASTLANGPVLSKNLPINPLGIFENPVFGKTTANFATQVTVGSGSGNSTLLDIAQVESVELIIPYFSKAVGSNGDGGNNYVLDSVYGQGEIKLSVWENGYFIRDNDVTSTTGEPQKYYTDQNDLFLNAKKGILDTNGDINPLNDSPLAVQNTNFAYSNFEQLKDSINIAGETSSVKVAPQMKISLNKDFFEQLIFSPTGRAKILSNNSFKEYFRGLYFQVEASNALSSNSLALLNFKGGKIRIVYKGRNTADLATTVKYRTMYLLLSGNTVSLQNNDYTSNYTQSLGQDAANTDRLWIKGGAGSTAFIDLFSPSQIQQLKDDKVLINEANIVFTVDQTTMAPLDEKYEPRRIYIYDAVSRRPIVDYVADPTNTNDKNSKSVLGGKLERTNGNKGKGVRYKFRITNYVRQLISQDSINHRLGISVTEDIRLIDNATLKNPQPGSIFDRVPVGSVINPFGTVLYGTSNNVSDDQKVKFEIYYTKSTIKL